MKEYSAWVDRVYNMNPKTERVEELERIINSFALFSKKSENLAKALSDLEEFEKPSFLTHIHAFPMGENPPGKIRHMMFKHPVYAVKHKKMPLVLAISKDKQAFSSFGDSDKIKDLDKCFDIQQVLSWVNVVSCLNRNEKAALVRLLVEGIEAQRGKKSSEERWLSDFIKREDEFKIVGFAANAPYINVDRAFGDTAPIWVHPWGIPALLLKHREMPAIMMVSPTIRLNENIYGSKAMEGYTG